MNHGLLLLEFRFWREKNWEGVGGWWGRGGLVGKGGVVGKGGGWSSVIFVTVLALRCTLEMLFIINIIYEKQHSEYCSTRFHYFVLCYKAPLDGTDGSG